MTTATLLANARLDLQAFQDRYRGILSEYVRSGGKPPLPGAGFAAGEDTADRIIASYLSKVHAVSALTRKANQEYLQSLAHNPQHAVYAGRY